MLPRPKYGTSTWYRWRGSAAVHAGGRGDRMTPVHTMKYTKIVRIFSGAVHQEERRQASVRKLHHNRGTQGVCTLSGEAPPRDAML